MDPTVIDELRLWAGRLYTWSELGGLCGMAADRIVELEAQVRNLEATVDRFEEADRWNP